MYIITWPAKNVSLGNVIVDAKICILDILDTYSLSRDNTTIIEEKLAMYLKCDGQKKSNFCQ